MTKADIIEALEGLDDDAEVKVALQRSYPFISHICNISRVTNRDGEEVGAVIACGDNEDYTTGDWWESDEVAVGDDDEWRPIDGDDETED